MADVVVEPLFVILQQEDSIFGRFIMQHELDTLLHSLRGLSEQYVSRVADITEQWIQVL